MELFPKIWEPNTPKSAKLRHTIPLFGDVRFDTHRFIEQTTLYYMYTQINHCDRYWQTYNVHYDIVQVPNKFHLD